MKKIIASVFLCLFGSESYANQFSLSRVEVDNLGNYDGKIFFLTLKDALKTDCAYSALYCTAGFCKRTYALVLAAKLGERKLQSINYAQDPVTKYCRISNIKFS